MGENQGEHMAWTRAVVRAEVKMARGFLALTRVRVTKMPDAKGVCSEAKWSESRF